jgi:hypothetical protein
MNFAAMVGRRSGRATPFLCNDPTMAHYETSRQVIHLSKAKRCLDQADHPVYKPDTYPKDHPDTITR